MEKRIDVRIILFTELSTDESLKTFIPYKGEPVIIEIPSTQVGSPSNYMMKIGDGVTAVSGLPWASAKAADVYSWAKATTKPEYDITEIKNLSTIVSNTELDLTNTLDATSAWTVQSGTKFQAIKSGKLVHISGTLINGATTNGTNIFTLPEGYRPNNAQYIIVHGFSDSGMEFIRLTVNTDGVVSITTGNNRMTSNEMIINSSIIIQ